MASPPPVPPSPPAPTPPAPPPPAPTPPAPTPPPVTNQAPTSAGLTLTAANEDGAVTILKSDLLAAASDPEGATLTLVGGITASAGTLVDNGDGTLTLTPAADFFGDITISYSVSDGTNTASLTATQPITNVNDSPVLGSVTLSAGSEDTDLTFTLTQLLGGATDVDGDTLTVTGISAVHGTVVDNGNGTFTYTPDAEYHGTEYLNYSISDGSVSQGVSATFTVNSVADAPLLSTYVGMSSPNEDGPFPGETVYSLFFTGYSDGDGDTLAGVAVVTNNTVSADGTWQYSADGGTTWVDIGGVNDGVSALALSASTKIRFNAAPDFHGTAPSLYVRGLDSSYAGGWSTNGSPVYVDTSSPGGASGIATAMTELATDVNAVNDAPVLGSITLPNGTEDTALTFTTAQLLGSTTDVDGDTLTVTGVSAINGTVVNNGNGTFTYTPNAGYNGTDTLNYTITDGTSPQNTSATFTVNSVNDSPSMAPTVTMTAITEDASSAGQTISSLFGSGFSDPDTMDTFAGIAVISNPITADGAWQYSSDGGTTWQDIGGVSTSSARMLSASTLIRFLPAADFNGTAPSFHIYGVDSSYAGSWSDSLANTPVAYNASSPGGNSPLAGSSTQVGVSVTAVNDAPTTSAVTLAAGAEDVPYTFTQAQLLANASDVEGDSLSITSITPSIGTVTNNGGGNYTLTLPQDYFGTVTFSYTISDGNSGTVAGTATTTIEDAPDLGLQAGGISFTYEESTTVSGDNYNAVADVNGDGLLDIIISNGTNGVVVGLNQGVASGGSSLFSYSTVASDNGYFSLGDLDGDGSLDLVVKNTVSDQLDVFLNDGTGNFTLSDSVPRSYAGQSTIFDVNGDGHQDVVFLRNSATEVFLGNGTGTFGTTPDQTVATIGTSITTGDIDGDGDTDVVLGVWNGDTVIVENVNGVLTVGATLDNHGTSVPAQAGSMLGGGLVDLDNDGDLDLFAANRYVEGYWFENDGTGNFTRHLVDSAIEERNNVIAADFDGDGDTDVLISAYNNLHLWRNDGGGTFTDVIAGSGLPTNLYTWGSAGDLDGDGDIDVVLQNTSANLTAVYSNNLVTSSAFSEGGGAVSVFPTLTVSDSDSATLTGAVVMIAANFGPGDVLSYTSYGGIGGSYDAMTGTLTLTGSASLADYQSVLRSVQFSNATTTMGAGNRLVSAYVTDGTNSSTPITQLITVTLDATLNTSAGTDTLDGGDGANVYVVGVGEFVAGDSIADTGPTNQVDILSLAAAGTFDLSVGAVTGIERLQMSAAGGNSVVLGGGADPQQFTSIVGGTGADSIALANTSSTLDLTGVSISSVETISTGAGDDIVRFDDVSKPGVGFVLDGDLSASDQDTAFFFAQAENSTMDVSAINFTGIEKVKIQAVADVAENPTYTGLNITMKGRAGGTDELYGGDGADTLIATTGNDSLNGGAGADNFVLVDNSNTTIADFSQGDGDVVVLSDAEFGLGNSGTLAATDYAESATAMSGTAVNYGAGNTGDGVVAIQNGTDVQLWHTTALEAATTANSTLIGTMSSVDTSTLDNTNFQLAV
ncbi:MAG: cadherin-like domain-containing protein [Magnetospirillum sp.]|nr:cadherin-like domain-containing protein [Magnetospirillum sp.]